MPKGRGFTPLSVKKTPDSCSCMRLMSIGCLRNFRKKPASVIFREPLLTGPFSSFSTYR